VNLLDLLIVVAIAFAVWGGYRLGFLARSLSWLGLALAILLSIRFTPDLVRSLAGATPRGRLFAVLAFIIGLGLLGQAIGLATSAALRRRFAASPVISTPDRVAGAVMGALGAVVFLWLLIPALSSANGWPARESRDSSILTALARVAPDPPPSLRELGQMVADAPGPEMLRFGETEPDAGAPPESGIPAAVHARVVPSVVKVEGQACDQIQDGSGFVVAPGVVVTNAHVVAGERRTSVIDSSGDHHAATVVRFDPRRDLAVLRVPGLDRPGLPLGRADVGAVGAVYGHPGGGSMRAAPARIASRIDARGNDIYRTTNTERDLFVLAAGLAPGDSGAALVDQAGQVVGVAVAIDPDPTHPTTAYALTDAELRPVLVDVPNRAADTGSCLVG
jgi:S1-C subfamily serine protease